MFSRENVNKQHCSDEVRARAHSAPQPEASGHVLFSIGW